MGRYYNVVATKAPVLDRGWRTALYPAGTTLEQAIAQEILIQGETGHVLDPLTVVRLTSYVVRTTAERLPDRDQYLGPSEADKGHRDVVAVFGMTVIRYRISGPGVHP